VILAVVFDGKDGTSFLLALDAETFQVLGRAIVPHHIPFGLHGQYVTCAATWEERHLDGRDLTIFAMVRVRPPASLSRFLQCPRKCPRENMEVESGVVRRRPIAFAKERC
jgi:hypothetical protein